jgi:integrase
MCPLRSRTVLLIRENLRDRGARPQDDEAIFIGARGAALTRHGILRVVQRCVRRASVTMPTLATKRVGAHTFRHTAAIHLLRAGNALPVIRFIVGGPARMNDALRAHRSCLQYRRAQAAASTDRSTARRSTFGARGPWDAGSGKPRSPAPLSF